MLNVLGLGGRATERNLDFLSEVEKTIGGRDTPVMIMCDIGGTLDPLENVPSRNFGIASRR